MQARDLMTTRVVTVTPDTSVQEVARALSGHGISAVPVVDAAAQLIGIVSEGDLVQRAEIGTTRPRAWWLSLLASPATLAAEYVRTHGRRASDVMSQPVITVAEDAPAAEIARVLEEHRIKRVPVVRNGRLVGIVSRADLVRALAVQAGGAGARVSGDDSTIRARLLEALASAPWITPGFVNVIVVGGVVHLWGVVSSEAERQAIRVAAENVPGVCGVEDHLRRSAA